MRSLILQNILGMLIIGVILGVVYATIDYFFDKHVYRKLSLGASLVSKTFIYFAITVGLLRL
ncbi:MAG: hypothetical protein AAFO99_02660, partial [Bacteroidota bacterium]